MYGFSVSFNPEVGPIRVGTDGKGYHWKEDSWFITPGSARSGEIIVSALTGDTGAASCFVNATITSVGNVGADDFSQFPSNEFPESTITDEAGCTVDLDYNLLGDPPTRPQVNTYTLTWHNDGGFTNPANQTFYVFSFVLTSGSDAGSYPAGSSYSRTYTKSGQFAPDTIKLYYGDAEHAVTNPVVSGGTFSFTIPADTEAPATAHVYLRDSSTGVTIDSDTITVTAVPSATVTQSTARRGDTISGTYTGFTPADVYTEVSASISLTDQSFAAGVWSGKIATDADLGTNSVRLTTDDDSTVVAGNITITAAPSRASRRRLPRRAPLARLR